MDVQKMHKFRWNGVIIHGNHLSDHSSVDTVIPGLERSSNNEKVIPLAIQLPQYIGGVQYAKKASKKMD